MKVEQATAERIFAAEAGIAGIRVAIIAFNSAAYLFLMDKTGTMPWLANAIIVAANAYGLAVFLLEPYRRFPVLLSAYFTSALDAAFITIWLLATGGVASPFHLLWLASIAAVAFRFGARETFFAAGLYAASYLGLAVALGQVVGNEIRLLTTAAYIFFTAGIGAFLTREVASQTRQKVEMQELANALRESEERFRRLSDATAEGIAIHEKGTILEVNGAFARMFGYEERELVGRSAVELVHPDSVPLLRERIAHPVETAFEIRATRKDGSVFDLELVGRDFPYEGRITRVVSVRDVTERKRAERAAQERAALEAANERLREMDGIKTKFINNAAHELGTPLTPIKLQAHLLKLGNLGELNDKQRRALDVLSRNVDHLGLMVKDLLDAARIQSQELRLKPTEVELSRLLTECIESFAGQGKVQFQLSCPSDLKAYGDPARLTQVVFNLIGNALKFTPPGGVIEVRARLHGREALVEVRDTGAGIDAAGLARLFQPFSQVHDTTSTSRAGTGLGLYISKGIVESHGGRIWAQSEGRGMGATFSFTLPATPSAFGVHAAADHVQ